MPTTFGLIWSKIIPNNKVTVSYLMELDLKKNNNSITFKDEKYIGLMSLIPKRTGTNRSRGFQGPSVQDDAIISLMTKTLFIATCTFNL